MLLLSTSLHLYYTKFGRFMFYLRRFFIPAFSHGVFIAAESPKSFRQLKKLTHAEYCRLLLVLVLSLFSLMQYYLRRKRIVSITFLEQKFRNQFLVRLKCIFPFFPPFFYPSLPKNIFQEWISCFCSQNHP